MKTYCGLWSYKRDGFFRGFSQQGVIVKLDDSIKGSLYTLMTLSSVNTSEILPPPPCTTKVAFQPDCSCLFVADSSSYKMMDHTDFCSLPLRYFSTPEFATFLQNRWRSSQVYKQEVNPEVGIRIVRVTYVFLLITYNTHVRLKYGTKFRIQKWKWQTHFLLTAQCSDGQ